MSDRLSDIVEKYFDERTRPYYMASWNRKHFHFGIYRADRIFKALPMLLYLRRQPAIRRLSEKALSGIKPEMSEHILDAGAGVGGLMELLHHRFGSRCVGVTLSNVQVEVGNQVFADAGLSDKLKIVWGDCSEPLEFADDSFNAVVCVEAACHFDDKHAFLSEVRRILKPGGTLMLIDWVRNDDESHPDFQEVITNMRRCWYVDPWSHGRYLSELGELGFTVEQEEILHGVSPIGYMFLWGSKNKKASQNTRDKNYYVGRGFADRILLENFIVASVP